MKKTSVVVVILAALGSSSVHAGFLGLSDPTDLKTNIEQIKQHFETSPANPINKRAAEFAANFAARSLTVVDRVEETGDGQRALVRVAGKTCSVDMVERNGQIQATAIDCGKEP